MRIALINGHRQKVGGVETYLEALAPRLAERRHALAFWSETETPAGETALALPGDVPAWSGLAGLETLRAWEPEVLYAQGFRDPDLEARALALAPTMFLAHSYYGTCISGRKAWSFPAPRVCGREFGPGCFLHYYPHRCGGLNPVTMWRDFQSQSRRLAAVRGAAAVAVLSEHMAEEFRRHGVAAEVLPALPTEARDAAPTAAPPLGSDAPLRLLYLGRLETLKGGSTLLDALPLLLEGGGRWERVVCGFAGVGSEEGKWRRRAARLEAASGGRLEVRFHGWVGPGERRKLLRGSHLLVVPSLWPEPLGLVGPEAAALGVPAVAFDVGGVRAWLRDGVNGLLAPVDPPRPATLAATIRRAVASAEVYERLRRGASESAAGSAERAARHLDALEALFARVRRAADFPLAAGRAAGRC